MLAAMLEGPPHALRHAEETLAAMRDTAVEVERAQAEEEAHRRRVAQAIQATSLLRMAAQKSSRLG